MKVKGWLYEIQRNKKGVSTLTIKTYEITQDQMNKICLRNEVDVELEIPNGKEEVKTSG